jgi:hypothetical protein
MGVCFLLGMYLVHEMGFWVESLKALLVRDGTSPVKGVITKKLEAFAACNPNTCTLVSYDRPNTWKAHSSEIEALMVTGDLGWSSGPGSALLF